MEILVAPNCLGRYLSKRGPYVLFFDGKEEDGINQILLETITGIIPKYSMITFLKVDWRKYQKYQRLKLNLEMNKIYAYFEGQIRNVVHNPNKTELDSFLTKCIDLYNLRLEKQANNAGIRSENRKLYKRTKLKDKIRIELTPEEREHRFKLLRKGILKKRIKLSNTDVSISNGTRQNCSEVKDTNISPKKDPLNSIKIKNTTLNAIKKNLKKKRQNSKEVSESKAENTKPNSSPILNFYKNLQSRNFETEINPLKPQETEIFNKILQSKSSLNNENIEMNKLESLNECQNNTKIEISNNASWKKLHDSDMAEKNPFLTTLLKIPVQKLDVKPIKNEVGDVSLLTQNINPSENKRKAETILKRNPMLKSFLASSIEDKSQNDSKSSILLSKTEYKRNLQKISQSSQKHFNFYKPKTNITTNRILNDPPRLRPNKNYNNPQEIQPPKYIIRGFNSMPKSDFGYGYNQNHKNNYLPQGYNCLPQPRFLYPQEISKHYTDFYMQNYPSINPNSGNFQPERHPIYPHIPTQNLNSINPTINPYNYKHDYIFPYSQKPEYSYIYPNIYNFGNMIRNQNIPIETSNLNIRPYFYSNNGNNFIKKQETKLENSSNSTPKFSRPWETQNTQTGEVQSDTSNIAENSMSKLENFEQNENSESPTDLSI